MNNEAPKPSFLDSLKAPEDADWKRLGQNLAHLQSEVGRQELMQEFDEVAEYALGSWQVLWNVVSEAEGMDKFGAMTTAVTTMFTRWMEGDWFSSEEEEAESDSEEEVATREPLHVPEAQAGLKERGEQLKAALEKPGNESWRDHGEKAAAKYNVPEESVWALIQLESRFNPGVPNAKGSKALGLGQFMPNTWKDFQAENPEFKDAVRTDPIASIYATAWYCRDNMNELGLTEPNLTAKLYTAHHEGAKGYRRLQRFRDNGTPFKLPPKHYKGHYFSIIDRVVEDCQDYSDLIAALAARTQKTGDYYALILGGSAAPDEGEGAALV